VGSLAIGAGLTFGVAIVLLMTFFVTGDARYDRIAEWAFVAFALLAVPTVLDTAGRLPAEGPLAGIATVSGVVGVAALGLGELASALRLADFRRLAPAMTAGFFAFLLWIGASSLLIVSGGDLPAVLGWLGVVSIALGVAIVFWILRTPGVLRGDREPPRSQMLAFFLPMLGIVAWLAGLGLTA
jgi:hypothetical protein